jgi:serine/threonine protein kinase
MFEMLTGRLPYTGSNQQELALAHIRDRIPMVTEFNPGVPDSLAKIVYKTMSKDPVARYRMADQLGHILISYRDRGRENTMQPAAPLPQQPNIPTIQSHPPQQPIIPPAPHIPQAPIQVGDPLPTQRYDLAPQAPQSGAPFRQQPVQQNPTGASRPFPTQGMTGQTSGYYVPQQYPQRRAASPALDVITIGLAILAFFAVACLIPLYIAVFQAQFG